MSIAPKSLAPRAPSTHEWRQPSTPNGELFTKTDSETGEVWTYHYDALGNLLSVDLPDGRLIEYVIDGQNRRIGKRIDGVLTKAWLYKDQLKPIAELDGSGNITARFIYGSKTNVPDVILRYAAGTVSRYRVISDHLGSPVMAVNVDNPAEVPFAAEYSAFGEMTVTSGASSNEWMPFGFAGGLYDADTDLVRFGARDYDAVTGRWTAKDPILWAGGQANMYAYSGNDVTNQVDTTGLATWICRALAQDPVLRFFNIDHRWVKTDTQEAGLGGAAGDTVVLDHSPDKMYYSDSERNGIVCDQQVHVDEECVNETLSNDIGTHMGAFGLTNNCITYADSVVRKCSVNSGNPSGPEDNGF